MTTTNSLDRALGSLQGLALGDALGMPTQSMSRNTIASTYGTIAGLVDAAPTQPIAAGLPAGSVTDDTEQALLVADLLLEGGETIEASRFARVLADWELGMKAKGSLDLLGPSTKAAIQAIQSGVSPEEAGRWGTTNGAAMRVTPVGIAFPPGSRLLAEVRQASWVTHNTSLGLSAAAAVAAAVSVGVEGGGLAESVEAAIHYATLARDLGNWTAGGAIPARIRWATSAIAPLGDADALDFVAEVVGTSVASQESVIAAFALVTRFDDEPYTALCHAASIGGDTDTIAAIAGAMLGARHGSRIWPADEIGQVVALNALELEPLAARLFDMRTRAAVAEVTP